MPSRVRELARRHLPPGLRRAAIRLTGDRISEHGHPRKADGDTGQAGQSAATGQEILEVLRRGGSLAEAVVAQVREDVAEGRDRRRRRVQRPARQPETATSAPSRRGSSPSAAASRSSRGRSCRPCRSSCGRRTHPRSTSAPGWPRCGDDTGLGQGTGGCRAVVRRTSRMARDARAGVRARRPRLGPALFDALDRTIGEGKGASRDLVVNRDWLRPWVAESPDDSSAPPVADDAVSFAVMDYGHPGRSRASANIGDHVQSIASLGHLARHEKLEFSGPQDLVDLLHQLQGRVRPERQLDDVEAKLQLLAVDRDASEFSAIPPNTWTLAFGWFMHAIFDTRYGFPFHPNLLPLFVSFHCSKRDLLTDDAIKYLRQYSPIGCRDWTTVDVLLSVDVPAFFSGCMTTTVSTVFPDTPHKPPPDAEVAYVDVPPEDVPDGAPTYRHSDDGIRFRSFVANMYDAIELLETYRRRHSGLVTSRLHCYLPGRSVGVPVDFQPKNRSDPRFAGLIDISDAEFDRIRDTISDKLRTVLTAVMSGKSPEAVYELWRDLNAADVEAARRRHEAPVEMSSPKTDLRAEVDHLRSTQTLPAIEDDVDPDAVQVVVHARGTSQQALEVLLASAVEHCSRRVQAWVVARKPGRLDVDALRAAAGGATVTVVGTRGLGDDLRRMDGTKPPGYDIDLLSLGHLLPTSTVPSYCRRTRWSSATSPSWPTWTWPASCSRRRPWWGSAAPAGSGFCTAPGTGCAAARPLPPSFVARGTRGTASTSTPSRSTCSCWTSRRPAAGRWCRPMCRTSRSSASASGRSCCSRWGPIASYFPSAGTWSRTGPRRPTHSWCTGQSPASRGPTTWSSVRSSGSRPLCRLRQRSVRAAERSVSSGTDSANGSSRRMSMMCPVSPDTRVARDARATASDDSRLSGGSSPNALVRIGVRGALGVDAVDPDAVGGPLVGQRLGEVHHGGLGRGVEAVAAAPARVGARGEEQQAAARASQVREELLRDEDRGEVVDLGGGVDRLLRRLRSGPRGSTPAVLTT